MTTLVLKQMKANQMSNSTLATIMKNGFGNFCKKADHAEAIISHETERGFAIAQANKCRKSGDDTGYGKWLSQARKYTYLSLKEAVASGIVADASLSNVKHGSLALMERMK